MANLNLDQDVANKRERKWITAHIVTKSFRKSDPFVTVLLLTSIPLDEGIYAMHAYYYE